MATTNKITVAGVLMAFLTGVAVGAILTLILENKPSTASPYRLDMLRQQAADKENYELAAYYRDQLKKKQTTTAN